MSPITFGAVVWLTSAAVPPAEHGFYRCSPNGVALSVRETYIFTEMKLGAMYLVEFACMSNTLRRFELPASALTTEMRK